MPIYPVCSGEVKESLRSVYSHKVNRVSQIENSISKSLNFLILKTGYAGTKQVVKSLIAVQSFKGLYSKGFPGYTKILLYSLNTNLFIRY